MADSLLDDILRFEENEVVEFKKGGENKARRGRKVAFC